MTEDEAATPLWRNPVLVAAAATVGTLFLSGVMAGVIVSVIEKGTVKPLAALIAVAALAGAAFLVRQLTRTVPGLLTHAAPRVLRARRLIAVSVVVGIVLGVAMAIGEISPESGDVRFLSDAPIKGWIAGLAIAVWLIVVPPLTLAWHRSIDEHEAQAYRQGALVAGYAYLFVTPAWWMGWRGSFLPEPAPMLIFLGVCVIWSVVWFARRYA